MMTTNSFVTILKEVSHFIPMLNNTELASMLHAVADAIRQGQSLGDTLEELGVSISGITDDGCGLLPEFRDISDDQELMTLAAECLANMQQAYRYR